MTNLACPSCGEPVEVGDRFCGWCAAPLQGEAAAATAGAAAPDASAVPDPPGPVSPPSVAPSLHAPAGRTSGASVDPLWRLGAALLLLVQLATSFLGPLAYVGVNFILVPVATVVLAFLRPDPWMGAALVPLGLHTFGLLTASLTFGTPFGLAQALAIAIGNAAVCAAIAYWRVNRG